jgi:hypothetical protein
LPAQDLHHLPHFLGAKGIQGVALGQRRFARLMLSMQTGRNFTNHSNNLEFFGWKMIELS